MATIVYEADKSVRCIYRDLGPDSLAIVEADAAQRGLTVGVVSVTEAIALQDSKDKKEKGK